MSQEDSARETPKKSNGSYVQVPSSLPINIKSSPSSSNFIPPSMTTKPLTPSSKEEELEKKRNSIRNHQNFPMIRKKFYYLNESDIFKGFIKGKGNLRDISQWLSDNYDKSAIVSKIEKEKEENLLKEKKRQEELNKERLAKQMEDLARHQELQREEEENRKNNALNEKQAEKPSQDEDDEDSSPIKSRGKARLKADSTSPRKPMRLSSLNDKSTRVNLGKPKMSILEKYKHKPKQQLSIDQVFKKQDEKTEESQPKRRRLVRGNDSTSATPDPEISKNLSEKFKFKDPELPKFNYDNNKTNFKKMKSEDSDNEIVADDDLDRIEEKIKQNKRKAKAEKVHVISDDDLEDDDAEDDSMSEEDEEVYNTGITSIDSQILEFLNNASTQDIVEISNIAPKVADALISHRPFNTIYEISENNFETEETPEAESNTKKRKTLRKALGLKIVENTEFSLKGYKAVDSLVKKCSEYGDLIKEQMSKWGVTVTGEGELEMTDLEVISNKKGLKYITKPALLDPSVDLKNYQLVGVNWLNLLYQNKLSCILADEMGLGKTCQVISFMAHLKSLETKGPHLVVVPSSTLENWLREFQKFCPEFAVQAYYGSQKEREELRYDLQDAEFDVMVTTYNLATGSAPDFKFLRNQNFDMIVYDEGHMLKNSNSERYTKLMRLKANFRLLLTGTPLQNNLKELVSLLAFMLPDLFNDKREDLQGLFKQKVSIDSEYNPLLSIQAISKAKTMMTPFVLRRKKVQVLKHLPAKTHEVVYCELTKSQQEIYDKYLNQGKATRIERERRKQLVGKEAEEARKVAIPTSSNVMMSLRKASMHPLLFRLIYTDAKLAKMSKLIMEEPEYVEANQQYILEDMSVMSDYELNNLCEKFPKTLGKYILKDSEFLNSGKISKFIEIINQAIEKKEKVLVFSLFTQMLDILEKIFSIHQIKFLRLDGQTTVDTRQDLIDTFYDDKTIPVFLLSTKAGGFGINLVAANNVIMYDQSYNPHDDKQAEDRAHRVGQTQEVKVNKLITKNTIEENMLQLAENKLELDQSISGSDVSESKFEEKAASMFEKILFGN